MAFYTNIPLPKAIHSSVGIKEDRWKPLDSLTKDSLLEFTSKGQQKHNSLRTLAQLDDIVAAKEHYTAIQGIYHPINRIPAELLGEIFSQYIKTRAAPEGPWSSASHIPAFTDSPSSPVTLSHVCGYWREVTLSMSTLWSSISISRPRMEQVNMVQLWLKRAGVSLLSISLSEQSSIETYSEDLKNSKARRLATDAILSAFLLYTHQWENINFGFDGAPSNLLLGFRGGCLPNLRTARLFSDKCPENDAQLDRIWSILHSSPMLHDVYWGTLYPDIYPMHVPWSQLRHISLLFRKMDEVLAILQLCPSLESLDLSDLNLNLNSTFHNSGITLPNLKELSVATDDEISLLYDSLTLPALEELTILQQRTSRPQTAKSFIQFLSRSGCQLKYFDWSHGDACEDELLAYLSAPQMSCIRLLTIYARFGENTIRSLTPLATNDGTECLLPFLENIIMTGGKVSKSTVSAMVSLRRNERQRDGIAWLDSAFIDTDT